MELISRTYFAEKLTEIGLELLVKRTSQNIDKKKLQSNLTDFILKQKKYNEICSLSEEIDFEGLIDYIDKELLDDLSTRVFSPKKEERSSARENIINKAIAISHAINKDAQEHVEKLISISIDIIREFYKQRNSYSDYIIASEFTDAVIDVIQESESRIKEHIDKNYALASAEAFYAKARNHDYKAIEEQLSLIEKTISAAHPLAPHYAFDRYMNSIPITASATAIYPPRVSVKAEMKIGGDYLSDISMDIFKYAHNHQLPIIIEIKDAKKFLGDVEDPVQDEAKRLIGTTFVMPPKEFPKIPYKILMNGETIYDYILLQIQEIQDDNTYIINNKAQQNSSIVSAKQTHRIEVFRLP